MSTNTALDQIKARVEKATPGPWHRPLNTRWKNAVTGIMPKGDPASRLVNNTDHEGNPERTTIVTAPTWSSGGFFRKQSGKDLEFIAHARTDVPKLLAALEAVAALHVAEGNGNCIACWDFNSDTDVKFPCPTVRAITEALR